MFRPQMAAFDRNKEIIKFQFVEMVIKREGWQNASVSPQNLHHSKQRKAKSVEKFIEI